MQMACTETDTIIITQPDSLIVTETHTDILCAGQNSTVKITMTGGTNPYEVSWSGGTATIQQPGDTATIQQPEGIVEYTITDANGCIAEITVEATVIANTPPEIIQCPDSLYIEACDVSAIGPLTYSETIVNISEVEFNTEGGIATDNCEVTSWSYFDYSTGDCPVIVIRNFIVGDASGLTDTCLQIIVIDDIEKPAFTVPDSAFVYRDENCNYDICETITGEPTNVNDNCDSDPLVTYTDSDSIEGTCF